jgi:AcrR family transcriptional regulator
MNNSKAIVNKKMFNIYEVILQNSFSFVKNWVMYIDFKVKMNEKLYLRDPESTEIGKQILKQGIQLLFKIGYEQFTFKKLATEINSTEATIYRYFENKHMLLIYLTDWYWSFVEFQVLFSINNLTDPKQKIKTVIDLLVWEDNASTFQSELDITSLYYIVIAEGSKTYLSREVDEHNTKQLYKPFKDLCGRIASIFLEYNPNFKAPASLASTLVTTAHLQYFFMQHLMRLSDCSKDKNPKDIEVYLETLVFGALDAQK